MIAGISRVRNEEHIIQRTLDHVSKFVDKIFIYDDCSTDKTVEICEAHSSVVHIERGEKWDERRDLMEGVLRQIIYEECLKHKPEWVYHFDADEFADFEGIDLTEADCFSMRLFDFYITGEDNGNAFYERKYMGPEYRDIPVLWRPKNDIYFKQRIPYGLPKRRKQSGFIKHYGKAISVEEWERTCDYYIKYFPRYAAKWKKRKGKAVHEISDFGRPLIQWEDRFNNDKIGPRIK